MEGGGGKGWKGAVTAEVKLGPKDVERNAEGHGGKLRKETQKQSRGVKTKRCKLKTVRTQINPARKVKEAHVRKRKSSRGGGGPFKV